MNTTSYRPPLQSPFAAYESFEGGFIEIKARARSFGSRSWSRIGHVSGRFYRNQPREVVGKTSILGVKTQRDHGIMSPLNDRDDDRGSRFDRSGRLEA